MGYQTASSSHWRYDQLNPPNMDYAVSVVHKVNASNQILLWGDSNTDGKAEENTTVGNNIYIINSQGQTATGASKAIRIEAAKALAACNTMPCWEALRDALLDRSVLVQEAAEQSLDQIGRSLVQGTLKDNEADIQEVLE